MLEVVAVVLVADAVLIAAEVAYRRRRRHRVDVLPIRPPSSAPPSHVTRLPLERKAPPL